MHKDPDPEQDLKDPKVLWGLDTSGRLGTSSSQLPPKPPEGRFLMTEGSEVLFLFLTHNDEESWRRVSKGEKSIRFQKLKTAEQCLS